MKAKNERNAGRKPTGMIPIVVRVTPDHAAWLRSNGQSKAVRNLIDKEMNNECKN